VRWHAYRGVKLRSARRLPSLGQGSGHPGHPGHAAGAVQDEAYCRRVADLVAGFATFVPTNSTA
jgi:hypothetical protein